MSTHSVNRRSSRVEAHPGHQPVQSGSAGDLFSAVRAVPPAGSAEQGAVRRLGRGRDPQRPHRVLQVGARGLRAAQRDRHTHGCKLENGKVTTPPGFKEAQKKLYEAGWKVISVHPEYGGAGAPRTVQVLVEEFMSGANTAFTMYSGLAYGAAEVIELFGTPEQKKLYVERMFGGT